MAQLILKKANKLRLAQDKLRNNPDLYVNTDADGFSHIMQWELVGDTRIYHIGNHVVNTLPKDPNTPIEDGEGSGESDPKEELASRILPRASEKNLNEYII